MKRQISYVFARTSSITYLVVSTTNGIVYQLVEGPEESFLGYRPRQWTCWPFRPVNFISNFTYETGLIILHGAYGAAQDEHQSAFLRELVNLAKDNPYPMLIGGDFNILRYQEEKNNDLFDTHWPFLFNVVIDSLDLREACMSGRQFIWANNRSVPTYEKLDRVLMDTEWELKFHMVTV